MQRCVLWNEHQIAFGCGAQVLAFKVHELPQSMNEEQGTLVRPQNKAQASKPPFAPSLSQRQPDVKITQHVRPIGPAERPSYDQSKHQTKFRPSCFKVPRHWPCMVPVSLGICCGLISGLSPPSSLLPMPRSILRGRAWSYQWCEGLSHCV